MSPTKRTIDVYAFKELPETVKEKVINRFREDVGVGYDWWDGSYDYFDRGLDKIGVEIDRRSGKKTPEMYFSGFCSQGDGLCFSGRIFLGKLLKAKHPDEEINTLLARVRGRLIQLLRKYKTVAKLVLLNEVTFQTEGHERGHTQSTTINDDLNSEGMLRVDATLVSDEQYKLLDALQDELVDEMQDFSDDVAAMVYRALEAEFEYMNSDEVIIKDIEANDYSFDINGRII